MTVLVLLLAVLVGVTLGLLGGGGSILMVPLLVFVAGMDEKVAIATSLFVVGCTSLGALVPHARAGRVRWKAGASFGAAAMVAAYLGGRMAGFISGGVLMVAFALMMVITAVGMLRGRTEPTTPRNTSARSQLIRMLSQGAAVGFVTGLIGAGGGFLIVPALVLLSGLPMTAAVATSLMVIVMNSFAGLAGQLANVQIDWSFALAVTAAAVVGSALGAWGSGRVPAEILRRGFGWFVLGMGVFILVQRVVLG